MEDQRKTKLHLVTFDKAQIQTTEEPPRHQITKQTQNTKTHIGMRVVNSSSGVTQGDTNRTIRSTRDQKSNRNHHISKKETNLSSFESKALARLHSKLAQDKSLATHYKKKKSNIPYHLVIPKKFKNFNKTLEFDINDITNITSQLDKNNDNPSLPEQPFLDLRSIIDDNENDENLNPNINENNRINDKDTHLLTTESPKTKDLTLVDNDTNNQKFDGQPNVNIDDKNYATSCENNSQIEHADQVLNPVCDIQANKSNKDTTNATSLTDQKNQTVNEACNEISIDTSLGPQCVSSPITKKSSSTLNSPELSIAQPVVSRSSIKPVTPLNPRISAIKNSTKSHQKINFDGFKSPDKSLSVIKPNKTKTSVHQVTPVNNIAVLPTERKDVSKTVTNHRLQHQYFRDDHLSALESQSSCLTTFNNSNLYSFSKIIPNLVNRDVSMDSMTQDDTSKNLSTFMNSSELILTRRQRRSQNIAPINDHYLGYIQNALSSKTKSKYLSFASQSPSSTTVADASFSDVVLDEQTSSRIQNSHNSLSNKSLNSKHDINPSFDGYSTISIKESANNVCIGTGQSFMDFCNEVDHMRFVNKLSKIYGMSQYLSGAEFNPTTINCSQSIDATLNNQSINIDAMNDAIPKLSKSIKNTTLLHESVLKKSMSVDEDKKSQLRSDDGCSAENLNNDNAKSNLDVTSGWALIENQQNLVHDITSGWLKYDTQRQIPMPLLLIKKPQKNASTQYSIIEDQTNLPKTQHNKKQFKNTQKDLPVKNVRRIMTRQEFAHHFINQNQQESSLISYVDLSLAKPMIPSFHDKLIYNTDNSKHNNDMDHIHDNDDQFGVNYPTGSLDDLPLIPHISMDDNTNDIQPPKLSKKIKTLSKGKNFKNKQQNTILVKKSKSNPVLTRRQQAKINKKSHQVNDKNITELQHLIKTQKPQNDKNNNNLLSVEYNDNNFDSKQNNVKALEMTKEYITKYFSNSCCSVKQTYLKGYVTVLPGKSLCHGESNERSLRHINFYVLSGKFEITDQCENKIRFEKGEYFEIRGGTRYQIQNLNKTKESRLYFQLVPIPNFKI